MCVALPADESEVDLLNPLALARALEGPSPAHSCMLCPRLCDTARKRGNVETPV